MQLSGKKEWRRTCGVHIGIDYAQSAAVENALDEAAPAVLGHPDERGDAGQQACRAESAGIADGEGRVLQVDEDAVVACRLC